MSKKDVLHHDFFMFVGQKVSGFTFKNKGSTLLLEFEGGTLLEILACRPNETWDEGPILQVNKLVEKEVIKKEIVREKIY